MNKLFSRLVFRALPLLFAGTIVTGCVTMTEAADPLKVPAVRGQSAAVVVSITSNTGQIRGFDEVRARRLPHAPTPADPLPNGDDYYILKRVAPGMSRDTTLFIGVLPAGQYDIFDLRDNRTHKVLKVTDWKASTLGLFTVTGDKPVDLGRLIVTPLNEKVLYGRSKLVSGNRELLQRYSAQYATLFAGETATGWDAPRAERDRVEEYAMLRPVGADCVTELDDGRVVAASRLGAVLVRGTDGRWKVLRGAGIESLSCVVPVKLPDADLLAVGEFGALLRHVPGAATLTPIDTGNLPPGNLLRIAGNLQAGWYVAHQREDDITIYHSRVLEKGDWRVVRQLSVKNDWWNGANMFWMWPTSTGFAYTPTEGPLQWLDFATGQWSTRPLPDDRRLIEIRTSPTGLISVLTSPGGGLGGLYAKVHVSEDEGRTWRLIESPFSVKISPVLQLADKTMLLYGGALTKAELQASRDGGKTWTHYADYEHGRVMYPLKSGKIVDNDLGQFGFSWIRTSSDNGHEWKTEYSNFDPVFYDMQQRARKK